jgi:hypothetical protein
MTETSFEASDVERLTAILDDVISDWDEPDRALMHELFARAGSASTDGGDEVGGYSFSWGTPAGQGAIPPGPCDGLFQSFSWGVGHSVTPGQHSELNPQPLPP